MKLFHFIAGRPAAAIAVALLFGAGLSGCGSSHDDNNGGGMPPTPAPVADLFFRSVSNFVAASSDTTEADPIDLLATTSPEDTEPEPLG